MKAWRKPTYLMGKPTPCGNSLRVYEDVAPEGQKPKTVSYNLPCVVEDAHETHKTATGKEWK